MAYLIQQWEATAARRRVPFKLFASDGTSPDTGASNDSMRGSCNGAAQFTLAGLISAISANAGMYYVEPTASDVSILGSLALFTDQGAFSQHVATVEVVAFDPHGSQTIVSSGKTLFAGSTTTATLHSTETGTNDWANGAFIILQYPSGVVVGNIISDSTGTVVQFKNTLPAAAASAMSYTIIPGTPETDLSLQTVASVLTVQGLAANAITATAIASNAITTAKVAAGTYSGVTLGVNNIAAGDYSGVTVEVDGITTAVGQTIADRLLLRSIAGGADSGRTVGTALYALRNKVDASSSVGTVYQVDDSTSAWTFSNTTGDFPISAVDPS